MAVLQLGLAGGRPVKAVLADALRRQAAVSANEWRMLAFYSWDTDEQQLVARRRAARHCWRGWRPPARRRDAETTTRLWLKALAASDDGQGVKPDAALRERVRSVLADPAVARRQMDVLTNGAADIVAALAPDAGAERAALVAAFDAALAPAAGRRDAVARRPPRRALLAASSWRGSTSRRARVRSKLPRRLLQAGARRRSRATTARSPTATSARR